MRKSFLFLMAVLVAAGLASCRKKGELQSGAGLVFGTYYNFQYFSDNNYQEAFDSIFAEVNSSLSTFDSTSIISQINRTGDSVEINQNFYNVLSVSQYVSTQTGGAFDITVAPLVNLWGFGYDPQDTATFKSQAVIDSVRAFVGYDKIKVENGRLVKADARTCLDCSAVAKGYACDLVADYLRSQGVSDFMVEIGGELVCSGTNKFGKLWRIGIVSPVDDSTQMQNDYEEVAELDNEAIATSGNYRQFYITKERKVSHTIDPRSGYPANSKVLSASVITSSCAVADAYATSFMVLGDTTAIKDVIKASKYDLEAYIIIDDGGTHRSCHFTR